MKKLIILSSLFLSLFIGTAMGDTIGTKIGTDLPLEQAISMLWVNGPSKSVELTLQKYSKSKNETKACKSLFALANLYLMQSNNVKAEECLTELSAKEKTPESITLIEKLKNILKKKRITKEQNKTKKLISIDFKKLPIQQIFKVIAQQANINLVCDKDVRGQMNISLKNVSIKQALDSVCASNHMDYTITDGIYRIYYPKKRILKNKAGNKPSQLKIKLNYLEIKDLKKIVEDIPEVKVEVLFDKNEIYFEGTPEGIEKAVSMLKSSDVKPQAHRISIKLWEVTNSKINPDNFSQLSTEKKESNANLLIAPRMILLPYKEGSIEIEQYEAEQTLDYNVTLKFHEEGLSSKKYNNKENLVYLSIKARLTYKLSKKNSYNKRKFNAQLTLRKNTWVTYPIVNGKTKIFMEMMVKPEL